MGVPGADDIMLQYQSTSFHDALYLRSTLGLRPSPEFEAWLAGDMPISSLSRCKRNCLPDNDGTPCRTIIRTSRSNLRDLTAARVSLPTDRQQHRHGGGAELPTCARTGTRRCSRRASSSFICAAAHLRNCRYRRKAPFLFFSCRSNAPDRAAYLRQPNLGRTLDPESVALLHPAACDLAIIVADGLSALAIERNAIPVLAHLLPQLLGGGWILGPLTLVEQGRVAIGDAIGSRLGARCSLILIGERPGLSSPDSMGAYLTWSPHTGRTDADRNCLSNIRSGGLSPVQAASRVIRYLEIARAMQRTGVLLKEGSAQLELNSRMDDGPGY